MVANADKCRLLTSDLEKVIIKIKNKILKNFLLEKLSGVVKDSRLPFKTHVENLCEIQGRNYIL